MPARGHFMDEISDAFFGERFASDERLRPKPNNQCSDDNSHTLAYSRPADHSQDAHNVGIGVRRRDLLSSSNFSSPRLSSFAIGSPLPLRSLVGVASMASPTQITT